MRRRSMEALLAAPWDTAQGDHQKNKWHQTTSSLMERRREGSHRPNFMCSSDLVFSPSAFALRDALVFTSSPIYLGQAAAMLREMHGVATRPASDLQHRGNATHRLE